MFGRHRRSAVALLAAVLAAVAVLVPGAPPAVANGVVPFEVQGSITQVATWGHTEGETVELLGPGGGVAASMDADAQGAALFRELAPGTGYAVRTDDGTSAPVEVTAADDHPDASFYESIDLAGGYGYLPTRDGTLLSVNILGIGATPKPVVVVYSGYDPSDPAGLPPEAILYALRGYVVVGVNMRGSGCSGGAFDYYEPATSTDGYDVIETVAAQSWSNGRVGMVGISYSGISQLYVAATQPPHLRAITPLSPYSDAGRGILYPGGIRNEGFAMDWALDRQAAAAPAARPWARKRIQEGDTTCADNQVLRLQSRDLEAMITPTKYDTDELQYLSISTFADRIEVPTYLAAQFQDEQTGGSAANLAHILQADGKPFRAVFGNGAHADPLGPTEIGRVVEFVDFYVGEQIPDMSLLNTVLPDALGPIFDSPIELPPDRFTGYPSFAAAKAAYEAEQPVRVRYEVGGVVDKEGAPYATATRSYDAWPLPGTTAERWYLQPDGAMTTTAPTIPDDSARATTGYRYRPDEGREQSFTGNGGNLWKRHPDITWDSPAEDAALTFTTPAATTTSIYAGTGSVDVWVGSSAADTDLEAVLTEVRPDGQEIYIQSGWLRVSQRGLDTAKSTELLPWPTHREADAAPIPSGELVKVRLATFPFAHVVRPGSKLRLSIEAPGGNQPLWAFTDLDGDSDNLVGHSVGRPSSVALPLISDSGAVAELPAAAPSCAVAGVTVQAQSLRLQPCRADEAPRRATAVVIEPVSPGSDDLEVTWTAPTAWADGAVPTGYEVELRPAGTVVSVGADATSAVVPDVAREGVVSAVVTPTYAGGGGVPSTASLGVDMTPSANEAFVHVAHSDFLGAAPSDEDRVQIAGDITSGDRTRRSWLDDIAASEAWVGHIVDQLYLDTLGRVGDAGGRTYWIDAITSGRLSVAKVAAAFYGSAEYFGGIGGGTLATWVADLYVKLLDRSGSPGEHAYWVEQAQRRGRGWVALRMFQSPESARDRVTVLYDTLLGRSPSGEDVAFWAPRVVRTGDITLAVDLAASQEYLDRAATRWP